VNGVPHACCHTGQNSTPCLLFRPLSVPRARQKQRRKQAQSKTFHAAFLCINTAASWMDQYSHPMTAHPSIHPPALLTKFSRSAASNGGGCAAHHYCTSLAFLLTAYYIHNDIDVAFCPLIYFVLPYETHAPRSALACFISHVCGVCQPRQPWCGSTCTLYHALAVRHPYITKPFQHPSRSLARGPLVGGG
jgi:hypothetical protein